MTTRRLPIQARLVGLLVFFSTSMALIAQHPLDSWVRRAVPGPGPELTSVAFGNGVFVAVGADSFVARSSNGVTWTSSTVGSYGRLKRVRFLNGQFIAVGSSDKIIYSADGASWTPSTLPRADFWDIAWGNGVYLLAGLSTYISADGATWTHTHPLLPHPPGSHVGPTYETPLDTVVFGNGVFLALPTGGRSPTFLNRRQTLSSTNGIDWNPLGGGHSTQSGGAGDLLYQDGLWISTVDGDAFTMDGVMVSPNGGASWEHRLQTFNSYSTALAYAEGYFVFLMRHPGALAQVVITSTNAFASWELRWTETNHARVVRSSAYGNGTFAAVGYDEASQSYILQSGNIGGAPIIFQEPQDRSAVVSNPASFTVQAVGAATLTYQWYRDNTIINDATNATYSIGQVATSDVGGYHVVITNSVGSVTSRVAQLTVAFLAIDQYAGITILGVPGRTYRIEATPTSGSPNWQTLTNLVLPATPHIWIDYDSPNVPSRVYRASELPP